MPDGTVPVVQGARGAAADYVALAFGERYRDSVLNEGRWPDLVKAFDAYRLSVIEECARISEMHDHRGDIATAIRALSSGVGEG